MNGWRLTGILSIALTAMALAFLGAHMGDVEGLRLVIRATARTSLVLFVLAFAAAAMAELVVNDWTRWQRRNRRYLGVSFAVSHFIHLGALIALAKVDQDLFWKLTSLANIFLAGAAYVFLAAMTATSFDGAAAWLGMRHWRMLHLVGGWYIWISFAVAIGKRLPQGSIYWAMMALLLAAGIVRLFAMARRNRRRSTLSAA
jgi:methionine sulfoxide reductase heme-binding subunit